MDLLVGVSKENPGTMTDKDIREEVDTFLFEGHDTSSIAITMAIIHLGLDQNIQVSKIVTKKYYQRILYNYLHQLIIYIKFEKILKTDFYHHNKRSNKPFEFYNIIICTPKVNTEIHIKCL